MIPPAPRKALRTLLLAAALLPATAAAQAPEVSAVTVHHGFPLAGGTLVVVVDGLPPGEDVLLKLVDAVSAPLSVIEELSASASPQFRFKVDDALVAKDGTLASVWTADASGRVLLEIPLDDAADADKPVQLQVLGFGGEEQATLLLHVQPPTLVVPTAQGLQRISLLDGRLLSPAIPGGGGLHGLAFSDDGLLGYVLRDGGVLQTLAARDWSDAPLASRTYDASADTLAGGPSGAAFLLARPEGEPFAAAGVVMFLDQGGFLLEPMAQAVEGRRVAVAADGLTAWVAEDDLIVREIDLLSRAPRALLPVGLPGDRAVADVLLDGRRLLVATRGPAGRGGCLSTLDLDDGRLETHVLGFDPLRLVPLGEGNVLVVPAAGNQAELLQDGLSVQRIFAQGAVRDAAAIDGGALLLVEGPKGAQLVRYALQAGGLQWRRQTPAPAVTRLVSTAGGQAGVVVLLGDLSGAVHVWRADRGVIEPVPGLAVDPAAAFHMLP